jgi:tetratricopeptide (TPR) repeat protein
MFKILITIIITVIFVPANVQGSEEGMYAAFNAELPSQSTTLITAEDWFNQGNALNRQGKLDEAIKAYDEAIRLDPKYVAAWGNKGNALDGQGKYDEAIKAYDEAIRLDPKYAIAWNNKGIALEALGKTTEANAAFAKVLGMV